MEPTAERLSPVFYSSIATYIPFHLLSWIINETAVFFTRGSVIVESIFLRASAFVNQTSVLFTTPIAQRLDLKKTAATGFLTVAASRWKMIIGYAKVSTTEQDLGLDHDDLKPAFDAWVDPTNGT